MDLISVWYCEAVVFVEDYRPNIHFFVSIVGGLLWERFGKGYW